jgi:GTPase
MAKTLDAKCSELRRRKGAAGDTCEVMVRLSVPAPERYIDVRVAVVGNVDSGKSTLVGVLSTGELDNGRGTARINVFRHKHEIMNGRTSSVSQQIVGFDAAGTVVNYGLRRHGHVPTWSDIVMASHKVITFIDLAGHERYLKTTVFGLTGMCPEYACVMLGANMGLQRMTKEHLGIALALQVPVFVVVTKVRLVCLLLYLPRALP